jgi:large subunit ribosomal protein L37Ae
MTKLGSASRFGSRYGTPLKQEVRDIEKVQKTAQICPQCGKKSLKRKGYAKWACKKCGTVLAGGAYYPQTDTGAVVERIIKKGEKYEEVAKELVKE